MDKPDMNADGQPKRLVILVSDFPPLAGTNVMRIQAFAKYLLDHDWHSTVVTRAIEDMHAIDMKQMALVPRDIRIVRVQSPDPFLWRRRRKGIEPVDVSEKDDDCPRMNRRHEPLDREDAARASFSRSVLPRLSLIVKNMLRYLTYIPDADRPWASAAALHLTRHVKDRGADVLLTSSPSYSCHVAGLAVRRRCGLPWVADFRDLWIGRPGRKSASIWHERWDRYYEERVVRTADRILVASPLWKENIGRRYGSEVERKIHFVPSGFDRSLLPDLPGRSADEKIHFVYTGAMYDTESPRPFLTALGALKRECPESIARVRVTLIGYAGDELPNLMRIITENRLGDTVSLHGTQPRQRCLEAQASADVLLLFSGSEHYETVRGKTYEYMASGKPILALIPAGGAQYQLLEPLGSACLVPYGDIDKTKDAIRNIMNDGFRSNLIADRTYVEKFDVARIVGGLAAILDGLM